MNHELYWKIRKIFIGVIFFFRKQRYRRTEKKDKELLKKQLNKSIAKTILGRLLLSSLIVSIIVGIDHIIIANTELSSFDVDLYKELLLGGMGIAGVILGLYCANIASVFSAKYSNVPKQIASDFQYDIITQSAIKEIIGYIVICTLTLILCIAEISVTWVSLSIISLLTIRMVVVFSISGTRTYILSDTFRIADIHTNNIDNAIRKISKRDAITSDISFQHHIQKVCEKDISILSEIAQYNLDIPATQNSSMCEFMDNNLILMGRYWKIKNTIPHNSKWFSEKTIYPQWHTSSHTEISIAARHSISIDSKQKTNPWWFEDAILAVNEICLDKLIRDADKPSIIKYLNKLAFLSSEASNAHTSTYWIQHLSAIQTKMLTFVSSIDNVDANIEDELASIFDILASAFVSALKAKSKQLASLNIVEILDYACTLNDNYDAKAAYLHFFNNDACDSLYRQISAENKIDKKRITPNWFLKQTVAKQIHTYLGERLQDVEQIIDVYMQAGQTLNEQKLTYCAAVFFAHCFEVISFCEQIIESVNVKLPNLEQNHMEKSYVWEEVTSQQAKDALNTLVKDIPALLVRNCGSFAIRNWNDREKKPDFLGMCYNHLCEHLIRAIETNDYIKFEALYRDFFSLTLLYQEYVRTNVVKKKEQHLQAAVVYAATDPYVEYGIISGLATLWGEFIADKRWRELVRISLDKFLQTDPENKKKTLTQITQVVQGRRAFMVGITNRSVMQTDWEMRVERAIIGNKAFQFEYREFGQKVLKTKSKLLYAFAGSLFNDILDFHNTEDVFFIVFINRYLDEGEKYKSQLGWEVDEDNENF